ncbi:hypothetical protein RHGRI_000293 [Rhododendron griersonianum]|uniref:Uncharacterized protein n=1 Tax=Rhododendron griersonianum TaxID=479676 RepID=A0AAV6LG28_9ERIC|nr:hypothetical protein RHGRI_000293 [Rhododendron griersonianum]KAG5564071.1 hypothetical protein RHGRI_000293 [Rhododendron griersonianum]
MSRRNIPRPIIPTKNANPARGRGTDQQQQQKKQKLSDEVPHPSASKTAPSETRRPPPQKDQGRQIEGPVDLGGGPSEAEVLRPFSPTYTTADGRVLMLKDSVKEEPNLAVTLLRGLALPRDCDQLPVELIPGLGDMCSHLVQAGQAALQAYDKAVKVTAERERYRTDRDDFKAKFKTSESRLQETDAKMEKLKKELVEAKTAAATAEAEVEKMKVEEKKKLEEADAKGYEAGIKRAALEYTQTAHQMVNDALEERLPEFFELGYAAGAEAMATVLVVETDTQFRKQVLRSDLFRGGATQRTTEMNSLTHQEIAIEKPQLRHMLSRKFLNIEHLLILEMTTKNVLHQQRGLVMEPTMPLEVMSSILKRMKEGAYKSSPMLLILICCRVELLEAECVLRLAVVRIQPELSINISSWSI